MTPWLHWIAAFLIVIAFLTVCVAVREWWEWWRGGSGYG